MHIAYSSDNYVVDFTKESDEHSNLKIQSLIVRRSYSDDDTDFKYSIKPLEKKCEHKWLYHVTEDTNIESIKKNGLIPNVGFLYINHWLAFIDDGHFNEIRDNLTPGVFLSIGQPISERWYGLSLCKINIDDLEKEFLYVDDSLEDSLIYLKTIAPENIQIASFSP